MLSCPPFLQHFPTTPTSLRVKACVPTTAHQVSCSLPHRLNPHTDILALPPTCHTHAHSRIFSPRRSSAWTALHGETTGLLSLTSHLGSETPSSLRPFWKLLCKRETQTLQIPLPSCPQFVHLHSPSHSLTNHSQFFSDCLYWRRAPWESEFYFVPYFTLNSYKVPGTYLSTQRIFIYIMCVCVQILESDKSAHGLQLRYLLAVWPWRGHITSLNLLKVIIIFSLQGTEVMHFKCPPWSTEAVIVIDMPISHLADIFPHPEPATPARALLLKHTRRVPTWPTHLWPAHLVLHLQGALVPRAVPHKLLLITRVAAVMGPPCRRCPSPPCLQDPISDTPLRHQGVSSTDFTSCYSFVCSPLAVAAPTRRQAHQSCSPALL